MKTALKLTITTILFVVLLASCSSDDDPAAAIKGTAEAPDGTPIAGAKITLSYDVGQTDTSGPTLMVAFPVSEEQHMIVEVFDSSGEELQYTIVNEQMAAGMYAVQWTGNNDSGSALPNDIYLIRITYESGETESLYVFLNRSYDADYQYDEIVTNIISDQDGRFEIRHDQLVHNHPLANELQINAGSSITLHAFDQNYGISDVLEVNYSNNRSSSEQVTISFSD